MNNHKGRLPNALNQLEIMSKKSLTILLVLAIIIVGILLFFSGGEAPIVDDNTPDNGQENEEPEVTLVNLYFLTVIDGQEAIVEVRRQILVTESVERAAIAALLAGPLPSEEAEGLTTAINQGTELLDLHISDGVARVDFNQRLQEGVAGSAWVGAIRQQIERTLLQFETVDEVIISIEGNVEEILQP